MTREPRPERNAEIAKMKEDGYSFAKIAKAHGISTGRAWQIYWREWRRKREAAK